MIQKPIFNLMVSIKNEQYLVGIVRFNRTSLSYFFTYPSDSPEVHFDCDTGQTSPALDHITWHRDRVHAKRKDHIAVEPIKYVDGELLSKPFSITPLYVESLYFQDQPCLMKGSSYATWSGSQSHELLNVGNCKGFSLIFLLLPSGHPIPYLLAGIQTAENPLGSDKPAIFFDLCDPNHTPVVMSVWEGWDLLVILSPYVRTILSPVPPEIGDSFRIYDYKNLPAAITDLMLQAKRA